MKRSEMVAEIFDLLRTSQLLDVEDDQKCAEKVLSTIESKGMLPPMLGSHVSMTVVHNAGRNPMSDLSWFMWEPEDEAQ